MSWKMLKMEPVTDIKVINNAYVARVNEIVPDKNSADFRRLYTEYKGAVRYALKENAIAAGKRPEDFDFNFNDDRYLEEFNIMLNVIVTTGLSDMLPVWSALFEDSDYRVLQRTDTFITYFDSYMSKASGIKPGIYKYLINHFNVYGFSAQKKGLIKHLMEYSGIKNDVLISTVEVPSSPVAAVPATPQATVRASVPSSAPVTTGTDTLLDRYMKVQDDAIVDRLFNEFFTKFDRIYSHEITKNNLTAWRYLMQNEKYVLLLRQAKFVEKFSNALRNVDDLYPAIWQYIIDKTRVPENHPMYPVTTGRLISYAKTHTYKGDIIPQQVLPNDVLKGIIDEDHYVKGHANATSMKPDTRKKNKGAGTVIFFFVLVFWFITKIMKIFS